MSRTHELKIWPSQFRAVADGVKCHEWRRRDRDFQVDDKLVLEEYDPHPEGEPPYSGRVIHARVTYVSTDFGVPDGWVVMSIAVLEVYDANTDDGKP